MSHDRTIVGATVPSRMIQWIIGLPDGGVEKGDEVTDSTDWSSKAHGRGTAGPTGTAGLNRLAVAAFTIAMFFGFLAPVTCAMGLAARAQIRSSGQAGAGLARAAVVISVVYLTIGLVVAGLYFFATGSS